MTPEEKQLNTSGYNLVTIIKRLEAATSRLEDISVLQAEANSNLCGSQGGTDASSQLLQDETNANEEITHELEEEETKPLFLTRFEDFYKELIEPFVVASKELNEEIYQAAELFAQAFEAQGHLLWLVSKSRKPSLDDPSFLESLKPINKKIEEINSIKESNRKSGYFNHLVTISEGSPVLGWIISTTPLSFIPEFKDSAQFWTNRIMKEYKEKDPRQVSWVRQFLSIFESLKAYVKEFHTTGPSWNQHGKPFTEVFAGSQDISKAAKQPASGGSAAPPPPPPPPPASLYDTSERSDPSATQDSGGMQAVFADLNKGEGITSGLKKVDKSEMTHKNPALRQAGGAGAPKKPLPPKKPNSLSSAPSLSPVSAKPPKKDLVDGSKWIIENFNSDSVSEPIVIDVDMSQSVFIGNCEDVTVILKGKANAVSVTGTRKTALVIDSLISGVDFIKSYKFGLQITGTVPMVSIDKCDEGSVYLSPATVDIILIFTCCATSLNVNVLKNEDYEELPLPEQFKHTIRDGKLVSEVVEHVG